MAEPDGMRTFKGTLAIAGLCGLLLIATACSSNRPGGAAGSVERGMDRGGAATQRGLEKAGDATGKALGTAIEKTGEGVGTAIDKTGKGLKRAGEALDGQ